MDLKTVEQKLQVLQFQHQRLAIQLEEKRRESKTLEGKVAVYENKEHEYTQTLLCVNRLWLQLNSDLQHLSSLISIQPSGTSLASDSRSQAALCNIQDPVLQRLLLSDPSSVKIVAEKQKKVLVELSDIEETLEERCKTTKEMLSKVLEQIQEISSKRNQILEQMRHSCAEELVQSQLKEAQSELTGLRTQYESLLAVHRSTDLQVSLASDRLLEAEERIKKLQNELADCEQELRSSEKKYIQLKNTGENSTILAQTSKVGEPIKTEAATENGPDCRMEVQELQNMLNKRAADIEKERELHLRTQRELRELQLKLVDESWVLGTNLYRLARQEVTSLMSQIDYKNKEVEAAQRERDEAFKDATMKSQHCMAEMMAQNRLAIQSRRFQDLSAAKAESDRLRQEAELALLNERKQYGNSKTVAELRKLVETLNSENILLRQNLSTKERYGERLEAATTSARDALSKVDLKEAELRRVREKLRKREVEVDEATRREASLRERLGDMRAFVEVLASACGDGGVEMDVRMSQMAMKKEIEELKVQLEGSEMMERIQRAESSSMSCHESLDALRVEADSLKASLAVRERELSDAMAQLVDCRAEADAYLAEIEALASAHEEMQAGSKALLDQLLERDEAAASVATERMSLTRNMANLQENLANVRAENERLAREAAEQAELREAAERKMMDVANSSAQVREQLRISSSRCESLAAEVRQRDERLNVMTVQLEAVQKLAEERKAALDEEGERASKEKSKRQRLDEENKILHSRIERLRKLTNQAAFSQELEEEVDAMRQLLNCAVCHERQKSVIITKCFHMFCDKCIKRNLESRNRKCPGCGVAFGQADVKNFFFT